MWLVVLKEWSGSQWEVVKTVIEKDDEEKAWAFLRLLNTRFEEIGLAKANPWRCYDVIGPAVES